MEQDLEKTQITDSNATQAFTSPQGETTQLAVTIECPVCHTQNAAGEMYCIECGFLLSSTPGEFGTLLTDEVGTYLVDIAAGREIPIIPGKNTIGRQDTDILLADPSVSRNHAVLYAENGVYYLEDVGSTNGTFVDNAQITKGERAELTNGISIKFGTVVMEFRAPSAPEPTMETEVGSVYPETLELEEGEEVAVPPEALEETEDITPADVTEEFVAETTVEPPIVKPEIVEPAVIGKLVAPDSTEYEIRVGITTIGRAAGNDIVLPDPYASSRHAQLLASDEGITLTDLGSTNGTAVNDQPLTKDVPVELTSGAVVHIGKEQYKFETI